MKLRGKQAGFFASKPISYKLFEYIIMKILYLAHRIPYPPNKGDKIRSFNEIKYLSHTNEIDLACLADDPTDLNHKADLEKFCNRMFVQPLNRTASKLKGMLSLIAGKSISVGYFWHRKLQSVVNHCLSEKEYEAIICFSSPMAEYVFRSTLFNQRFSNFEIENPKNKFCNLQSAIRNPLLIMDFCDLDSDKWRQYSEQTKFPLNVIYKLEFKRLLKYEKKVNQTFNHSIFVSQNEAKLFSNLYPEAKNINVIPNGVDTEYFSPDAMTSEPSTLPRDSFDKPNKLNQSINFRTS
ncbi:MAG: hypothetical protein ACW99Q_27760, partial [Candidatus Kariarchaeaceae archaeon]